MKVSELLIHELIQELGAPLLAGVSGANIESVYEAALCAGLEPILARHEFGAATIVDGYARTSGRPGVLLCTSGAGALNAIPGIAESFVSRTPMIALMGEPPLSSRGRGAFQETSGIQGAPDLLRMLEPVSRFLTRVESADQALPAIRAAMASTRSPLSGPAVLLLPRDVQEASASEPMADCKRADRESRPSPPFSTALLEPRGRKPLFILGETLARHPDVGPRMIAWLERRGFPFLLTVQARALCSLDHPLCRGVIGVLGTTGAAEAAADSDEIIVAGTRLDEIDRYGIESTILEKTARFLHIEPCGIHGKAWTHHECDARSLLEGLPPVERPRETHPRTSSVSTPVSTAPIGLSDLLPLLSDFSMSRPRNWLFDAGNASAAVAGRLPLASGSTFTIALGMGGMGYTFGAAIGNHLANRIPSAVFAGDGAAFMHGSEMSTAVEKDLPILFIIADNRGHDMCTTREELILGRRESGLNRIRRSELAAGLGAMYPTAAVRAARTQGECVRALAELSEVRGPAALVIEVASGEIPPFLPFLDLIHRRKNP